MTLADLIIESGRLDAGEVYRPPMTTEQIYQLRAELIEGRRLQAAAETRSRFSAVARSWGDADLELSCDRCGWYANLGDDPMTLAELVQRADEHAEGCR